MGLRALLLTINKFVCFAPPIIRSARFSWPVIASSAAGIWCSASLDLAEDMLLRLTARRALTGRAGGLWLAAGFSSTARAGRLEGKVALITGAASGIGKATAHEFIQEGATVVLADIDSSFGPQVAQSLGPKAHFIRCDVTDEAQVAAAVDFAFSLHNHLDVMYNNAGIVGPPSHPDIAHLDLAAFDRVMTVNARGTLAGVKHAARVMGPLGSGSILCTASISGLMGGLGTHPYSISKFAVAGIVKSAAAELSKKGVRVNCISPFAVATRMTMEQFEMIFQGLEREKIVKIIDGLGELRGAKCEEVDVAKAAVYLASDEAKYVTGHNLVVDGGFTSIKQLNLTMPDGLV